MNAIAPKLAGKFQVSTTVIKLIPICFIALFKKVEWKPIEHTSTMTMEDIEAEERLQELPLDEQIKLMSRRDDDNDNRTSA